jgi:uncharacterized membrane protein
MNANSGRKGYFTTMFHDRYFVFTAIIGILFSSIFSAYSIYKYYALDASAFDLGLHANILWNALHGQLFYSGLLGGSFMAEHFAPFEYLQLPIYYIYPSPVSILLFQDVFLAMAVLPLYKIMQFLFKSRIKDSHLYGIIIYIVAISYEVSPFTASIYSFDFHNMAFLSFFVFTAIYAFLYNKKILNIAMLILIVSLHSNFVYISLMIILFEILYSRKYPDLGLIFSRIKYRRILASYFILFVFIGFLYIEVAGFSKGYITGHIAAAQITTGESGTVPGGLVGMIKALFTDPAYLFSFISANYILKITYLALLLGTTGGMALFFPEILLIGLPYFGYAFTSSYGSYYVLGYQYAGMIYPVMFLGIAFGISKIIDNLESQKKPRLTSKRIFLSYKKHGQKDTLKIIAAVLIAGLFVGLVFNPLIPYDNLSMNDISGIHMTGCTAYLIKERKNIPENSSLLVENNIMPLFSDYAHVYMTPFSPLPNYTSFNYIIYINNTFWAVTGGNNSLEHIANYTLQDKDMSVYSEYDNKVIILKKT